MHHIARLDGNGVLIAISDVTEQDWETNKDKGVVMLPEFHDMSDRIGQYYYDFEKSCFLPNVTTGDDLDDIIDTLAEAVVDIARHAKIRLSDKHAEQIQKWKDAKRQ